MKKLKLDGRTALALILMALLTVVACSDSTTDSGGSALTTVAAAADVTNGAMEWANQCSNCHGANGEVSQGSGPLNSTSTYLMGDFDDLVTKIDTSMPRFNAPNCVGVCAVDTAAYIMCSLNTGIANGCPPLVP